VYDSSPRGREEVPTAAAHLVILLLPVEEWPLADRLLEPTPVVLTRPQPDASSTGAGTRTLPGADPEFATCYQAEMPALIRFLIICGANSRDAADAGREAFLLLFKQWPAVQKPRQWLRAVAFRIFLNQPVGDAASLLDTAQDLLGPLSASTRVAFREEEQLVLEALDLLPTTQRAVLALHYDNFGVHEIAEILGMQQATVQKNLKWGRAALKKKLGLKDERSRPSDGPSAEGAEDEPSK
jgi:RNA polymerase sigma factor (sigma-70 family)